ncbi:MAG: molybdopterin biosynthesis protein, partial [Planctomycetes bacterium]|nr:molybdopterin biosynthesis protein [Planctomycetota bacterium]
MSDQEQFLEVVDRDEAERRFRSKIRLEPIGTESVPLDQALGRVLSDDVIAKVDVPSFDRSNFDGFAVKGVDTYGASEMAPKRLWLRDESLEAGIAPTVSLNPGEAVSISTGGMIPRGADSIVMIEHADVEKIDKSQSTSASHLPSSQKTVVVRRAVTPGFGVSFAGTDISTGETVLRVGTVLTSRETGLLAALGETSVSVWKQPVVGIVSTGNEILAPGQPLRSASVYDSNSQILSDAVRELGGIPRFRGIVRDDLNQLRSILKSAIAESDLVLLSGGTSKGHGDLCYRAVSELNDPGIVAHGVALKPGKPLCLASTNGKPVVVLPGFPTSAIFTFHEFVAPVIRLLGGRQQDAGETVRAKMAIKTNSEI